MFPTGLQLNIDAVITFDYPDLLPSSALLMRPVSLPLSLWIGDFGFGGQILEVYSLETAIGRVKD